jgi:RNA polymerase sigma-70 factor, ECF subfamily
MATIQPIAENEQHPDVALVERVRAGDISAYDTLVRKYDRQVFRIAQHITQNREDAEDVVQDAFLKAYEKLDQFQGNSKFYTWLVRIAVNESLMRLRKRRTGRMVSIDEDVETEEGSVPRDLADWAPDPEQNYTQAELAEILRKTIQGLPQGFRVVFVLRDVEGLSTEETAETLGLSVPAVKSRLLRARLQLRERLTRSVRARRYRQILLECELEQSLARHLYLVAFRDDFRGCARPCADSRANRCPLASIDSGADDGAKRRSANRPPRSARAARPADGFVVSRH